VLPVTEGDSEKPIELPSGAWEAPPVRAPGRSDSDDGSRSESTQKKLAEVDDSYVKPPAARYAWKIVAGLVVVVIGILGVAGYITYQVLQIGIEDKATKADSLYAERKYDQAAKLFRELLEGADDERAPKFRFFAEMSDLLHSMGGV